MPPRASYPSPSIANLHNGPHDSVSHGEIDQNQAAMLQAMARRTHNSSAETDVTAADTGVNYLPPLSDEERNETAQLGMVLQDEIRRFLGHTPADATVAVVEGEDPAALLGAIAAHENHSPENARGIGYQGVEAGNDHFAELLQAAATAGGAEDEQQRGRRAKRKVVDAEEEAAQLEMQRQIWGPEEHEENAGANDVAVTMDAPGAPVGAKAAKAASIHSASALFRAPTAASKKYTRQPMSKLFTSLELSTEQFLHLQAAAKTYMLDPAHPERRDCVGSRDRGDTDMVKLKLFNCVKSFLEDEGWGEGLWGSQSIGLPNRKLQWPAVTNKIVLLVTPLLRRMVTNERQRLYAIETRGKAPPAANKGTKRPAEASPVEHLFTSIDPSLAVDPYALSTQFHSSPPPAAAGSPTYQFNPTPPPSALPLTFHVSITTRSNPTRIRPKLTLTPTTCPNFPSLVQHINNLLSTFDGDHSHAPVLERIRVLTPNGLADVGTQEDWLRVVDEVCGVEWLDGEIRVVVEVRGADV